MEVTTKLTRFGLRLAKELTGTLTVGIDAYDAELCKVGSGSVSTPVGSPYRFEITASMKTVSPRRCPPPPPARRARQTCFAGPIRCRRNTFQSLWAVAANDVWAVGDAGTIHHYDGSKWTAVAKRNHRKPAVGLGRVCHGSHRRRNKWKGASVTTEPSGPPRPPAAQALVSDLGQRNQHICRW